MSSAGRVSYQNPALASTYKVPPKPTIEGDGPIAIRTTEPEDRAEAPEALSNGDTMASAKARPLPKPVGKPAVALGSAAGIPPEFLASNDHKLQDDKAPAAKKAGKPAKTQIAMAKDVKKAPAKSKTDASQVSKGKSSKENKNREYKVQLGAYKSEARAEQAWKALMSKSKDLLGDLSHSVVKAETDTELGTVYRLRTGPHEDWAVSEDLCSQLQSRSVGCFVVASDIGNDLVATETAPSRPEVKKLKRWIVEEARSDEFQEPGAESVAPPLKLPTEI